MGLTKMIEHDKDKVIHALRTIVMSMSKKIMEKNRKILTLESAVQRNNLQLIRTGMKQLYC